MTDDGAFRVITARTTTTVGGAIRAQGARGRTARYFGDLITGAILFRETMAPSLRVQGILKGAEGGSLVADSHPSGDTRGLVQPAEASDVTLGEGATLRLMRSLPDGRLNQGIVAVPERGGISTALMAYMQSSEQVVSMLAVGTVLHDDDVVSAGGYMVQLLPEVDRGPLAVMTERLDDFEAIEATVEEPDFSPSMLLDRLLYGMPYTHLDQSTVAFNCWCSHVRVLSALATLGRGDLESLVNDGEVLQISCDYCGEGYEVAPEQLRGLLEES